MRREYTLTLRWKKAELLAAAGKVARTLGVPLFARTKAELASFLVHYEEEAKRAEAARG
jgi:hypothetical protein